MFYGQNGTLHFLYSEVLRNILQSSSEPLNVLHRIWVEIRKNRIIKITSLRIVPERCEWSHFLCRDVKSKKVIGIFPPMSSFDLITEFVLIFIEIYCLSENPFV